MRIDKCICKCILIIFILTSFLVIPAGGYAQVNDGLKYLKNNEFDPSGVIVALKKGNENKNRIELIKSLGAKGIVDLLRAKKPNYIKKETKKISDFKLLRVELYGNDKQNVINALNILKKNPNVEYAVPDYLIEFDETYPQELSTPRPNPTEYPYNLWHLDKIEAPKAWDYSNGKIIPQKGVTYSTSTDVVIGVIDTGVNYNHIDLDDNMWNNPNETPGDNIDNDGNGIIDDYYGYNFYSNNSNPMDTRGHGTHVAGVIAAEGNNSNSALGVAWGAKIAALKITCDEGTCQIPGDHFRHARISAVLSALDYCNMMNIQITNNSYRFLLKNDLDKEPEIEEADTKFFKDCINEYDGLVITSAGNESANIDIPGPLVQYPASFDCFNIITVAASSTNDSKEDYSNFGNIAVDLAAPGQFIWSAAYFPNLPEEINENFYYLVGYTSNATPQVAGAAALLKAYGLGRGIKFTNSQIRECILNSTDNVGLPVLTRGRLNLAKLFNNFHYEAEDSHFNGATQSHIGHSKCSGNGDVHNVGGLSGNNNYLQFNNIKYVKNDYGDGTALKYTSGEFTMRVYYRVNGTRDLFVSVNGESGISYPLTGPNWSTVVAKDFKINLKYGVNTIRFYNPTNWAPDIDKIEIFDDTPSYEAEDEDYSTLAGAAFYCNHTDNTSGSDVHNIGGTTNNYLQFNNINVHDSGTYTMKISYFLSGSRDLYVSVNGGIGILNKCTGSDWNTPKTMDIEVYLHSGINTIKLYNPTNWAPDIDKIEIFR